VDFGRDVQPILQTHCVECHGPKKQKNGFRLDRRSDAFKGGTAAMIGRGNADASRLYLRLTGAGIDTQMPPDGPLNAEQIGIIKRWIDQGADWPDALSGETPPAPADPKATQIMEALRSGDTPGFRKLLRENPDAVKRSGAGGSTPLAYAVLYGDVDAVKLVLQAGADVNARSEAGATALMFAADNLEKSRLLLQAGADPKARSADGRTPLLVACSWSQTYDVIKLLLDHGADPSDVVNSYRGPLTPLRLAAEKGDEATLRLLLDRGADARAFGGVPALMAATSIGDVHSAKLLLPSAAPPAIKSAATFFLLPPFASPRGTSDPTAMQFMIDAGADLRARDSAGRSLLMLALTSEKISEATVKAMIQAGADVNATTPAGMTVLDFALQQGKTPIVDLLEKAGAKPGHAAARPKPRFVPAASARAAVERSLPLLQKADAMFLQKSGCVSCHNNSLTAMTVSEARKAGIALDEKIAQSSRSLVAADVEVWRERSLQGMGIPGDSNTINWMLLGLAAENYPADAGTDAFARFLKNDQLPDGRWRLVAGRPPINSSDIAITAISMRAMKAYAPKAAHQDYLQAASRAANWIRSARPLTTDDRAFQLLGLIWAGDEPASLKPVAGELVSQQKSDGGWSQLPAMPSDAYATGLVLVALSNSGAIPVNDPAFQRGIEYLRATQLQDGSWHVATRAIAIQPYFESGFPHGEDQWISAAATNWATMALIKSVR
jgi:ankyrin repeat protein